MISSVKSWIWESKNFVYAVSLRKVLSSIIVKKPPTILTLAVFMTFVTICKYNLNEVSPSTICFTFQLHYLLRISVKSKNNFTRRVLIVKLVCMKSFGEVDSKATEGILGRFLIICRK